MTTQERLEKMIYEKAVFKSDIAKMMPLIKEKVAEKLPEITITWDRPSTEYPDAIFGALFITAKPIIVKWFEENKPQAFQIQMFK